MTPPPCASCPWRVDATPDNIPNFKLELAENLANCQSGELGAPIFACHLSKVDKEIPCAGWLVAHGWDSIAVRLRLLTRKLDPAAMYPGEDWPELHATYDEMMIKLRKDA